MKNSKKLIIFYLLIILTLFSLLFTWKNCKSDNLVNVILETKIEKNNDILLKVDNNFFTFKQFNNVINQTISKDFSSLELLIKENYKKEIKSIVVFNDTKMYYFNDFSDFIQEKEKLCDGNICQNYYKYKFQDEIIIPQKTKTHTFLNSLVEFNKLFYPFYILLFLTIFYGYKLKLNKLILPILILFLGIILRLNTITSYGPWLDECYSILISQKHQSFLNLFNDPGNPPFYYLILKITQYFTESIVIFRFISVIFSISAGIILYLFLNKKCGLKMANIFAFLYAINIPIIYYSQEIRCYSFLILLTVLILVYVFKLIENSSIKNWIIYGILTIISVNTHYYQILFAFSNFIFLAYYFIKNKKKNDLIWLFGINLTAMLSFLPYYILTAHNKALLDINFNLQLQPITPNLIKKHLYFIFGGFFSFAWSILFLFKNPENKKLFSYSIWSIFCIISTGIMLSITIRPIMAEKYVLFLIPFALIILSLIFSHNYKNKLIFLAIILCLFSMQVYSKNSFINYRRISSQIHNAFYIANKYKEKHSNKTVVIAKNWDYFIKDLYKYDEISYEKIPKHNSFEATEIKIKEIKNNDKSATIFTSFLENNQENLNKNNYVCYFNSGLDLCIWKIE